MLLAQPNRTQTARSDVKPQLLLTECGERDMASSQGGIDRCLV